YLRHAGVMALTWIGDLESLLAAAESKSSAVRMGILLALRRLQRVEVSSFLNDPEPALVLEAARAIHDEPINGAMADLAALLGSPTLNRFLSGAPLLPSATTNNLTASEINRLGLEALLRRVIDANFHFGTVKAAQALASFAARVEAPSAMRVEALEDL